MQFWADAMKLKKNISNMPNILKQFLNFETIRSRCTVDAILGRCNETEKKHQQHAKYPETVS